MRLFLRPFAALASAFWLLAAAPLASAEPVCVVKHQVTLRRGPGPKFPVSWSVPKYMPFEKLEEKNGWYRVVDLEGEKHWLPAKAVSRKKSCLVVKKKTAQLHRGPGAAEPLAELSRVDKYTPFLKTDRDGEWVKVTDEYNGSYWIHEGDVWIPMARMQVTF